MRDMLKCKADELGVDLDDRMLDQFEMFYRLLTEKNKVMNLTSITEPEMVVDRHFIDSLSVVKCVDMRSVKTVIDVGTGAGFPAIPLKIAFPHLQITLLDSLNKRIEFLNEAINELMFDNMTAVHLRAEDAAHDRLYRQKYDLAVSRAVADLAVLSEYCLPFVRCGGKFAAYKSGSSEAEIRRAGKAIKVLGGRICATSSFDLPGTDLSRTIVAVEKTGSTAGRYPRRAGTPAKSPIL